MKLVNPTDLAKRIFQDVWISSGKKPEGCLHTFVELFIFKYLSDLGILKGIFNFETLFNMYKDNEENDVLNHYSSIIRPEIKRLFPENLLDKTTIINGTIFVNKDQKPVYSYSTLFKTVLEKFDSYGKLENIDHDFKSKLFESFLKESISRKNWGQFFTPIKVVRAINQMAGEPKEGMKICDPACGVGKFPLEFIKDKLNKLFWVEDGKIVQKVQIIGFDRGLEEDEQWIILAKANTLIYFCELIRDNVGLTKELSDFFNKSFISKNDSILGTLSEPIKNEYDLILTNPPYVVSGSSNLKNEIKRNPDLKKHYEIDAIGFEGLFVEWIIRSLKGEGRAFIIIPDGILNRKNDQKLREFILNTCYLDAIISLPEKTFFRTPKKTYIIAITKKKRNENGVFEKQTNPVFTYLVSEIGEKRDNYRFSIEQDDLSEAVILFQFFKGNKREFDRILDERDKRCKIQGINKFVTETKNWSIDRWWTKEELTEIGIVKKKNTVDLNGFSKLIEDVSDKLKSLGKSAKYIDKERNKITFKEVLLSDIFEIKKGSSKYTNEFINQNPGEYPVYSSQTINEGIIGKINSYDYDHECLTWTTDGYAGIVFLRKGKFSITTHCGALIPKNQNQNQNQNLLLDYLHWYLSENLKEHALGSQNKRITVDIIENIKIKIPITEEGKFDVLSQQKIIKQYQHIKELKKMVKIDKQKIKELTISIERERERERERESNLDLIELFP